jgi:membrane-associated phospholipid phosphatase
MPRLLHIHIALVLLLVAVAPAIAATPDSLTTVTDTLHLEPTRIDKFLDDLRIIGVDGLAYVTAPARWSGNDWYYVGGTFAGIGVGLTVDRSMRREVVSTQFSSTQTDILVWGSRYGELLYSQLFAGGVYVTGLALDHDDIRVTGRLLAQSLLYSGAFTMAVRFLIGRARPSGTDDPFIFKGFQKSNEVQSFPSGHTTVAFGLSSVLADRIGHPVATVLLYSMATLTAISRIGLNRHWVSDVVAGAVIGTSAGLFVCEQERQRNELPSAGHSGLQIMPSPAGLAIVLTF